MAATIFVACDALIYPKGWEVIVDELVTWNRAADASCLANSKAFLYFEAFKVHTHTYTNSAV